MMSEMTQNGAPRRTILITGCSSGIGYAAAHGLRARGWTVFAACREAADCARLQSEGFVAPRLDYADEPSIHAAFDEVMAATGGRLDALFNNGAYASAGAVEDIPTDALREIFEANFFGWHTLSRLALRVMRRQGFGRLVQCSSVLGFSTMTYRGAYQATKFALEGLTDTLRLELHGSGIHAVLIEPGPIDTAIRRNAFRHYQRWLPAEVAAHGSAHAHVYPKIEARLTATSVEKAPFELKAEAVVEKLARALDAKRPKPRYYVTTATYIVGFAKRFLSTGLFDRLLRKISE